MFKEALKELLHFWKTLFLIIVGIILFFTVYVAVAHSFKGDKYLKLRAEKLKTEFLKNRAQFEEIMKRFDKDKKLFYIGRTGAGKAIVRELDGDKKTEITKTIDYQARISALNDFRIDYYGINRDIIRIKRFGNRSFLNEAAPATLNELYGYYGLKEEEVQWHVDKLAGLKYYSADKMEIPVEGGGKSRVIEFIKFDNHGIIYNPDNKMPEKQKNGRYKFWEVFERIENYWFLYID